jgi:hypothetical protein
MTVTQHYDPEADLTALSEHPDNPRRGDDGAVADSVDANGFYGAILAQASTGHVLAGHTRRRVLLDKGETTGPVIWVDVDDATARRILLADNRMAELATWDDEALLRVLSELGGADPAGLDGTGFDAEMLSALAADLGEVTMPTVERKDREHVADRYQNTELRQVTFALRVTEYNELVTRLETLRSQWGLDTYAAVVTRLVTEATERAEASV